MINKDFFKALNDLETQKGISKEFFIEALEAALTSAYKKRVGEAKSAFVKLNPEKNSIRVYSYKTVVEEVEDTDKEISLEEAKTIKKTAKLGDIIQEEESPKNFGRIAAQTAKQVVMQRLREYERNKILNEVSNKQGKLITAVIRRVEGDNVYANIGMSQVDGVLSKADRIPGEKYAINSNVKVFVKAVKESYNMPYVQLSRTSPEFVRELFMLEVPEIACEDIIIKNIAREAGNRTKIAVYSTRQDIDVVGACIGQKNMRIGAIVNELNGEKVDVVEYSEDPVEYITSALSPASVLHIELNQEDKTSLVIVPDDKLSLAIGKGGQNVRLAARLTGWKIDVKAKSAVPSLNMHLNDSESTSEELFKQIEEDNENLIDIDNLFEDGAFDDLE